MIIQTSPRFRMLLPTIVLNNYWTLMECFISCKSNSDAFELDIVAKRCIYFFRHVCLKICTNRASQVLVWNSAWKIQRDQIYQTDLPTNVLHSTFPQFQKRCSAVSCTLGHIFSPDSFWNNLTTSSMTIKKEYDLLYQRKFWVPIFY